MASPRRCTNLCMPGRDRRVLSFRLISRCATLAELALYPLGGARCDVPGDCPHEGREFTCDRSCDYRRLLALSPQHAKPLTKSNLRLPSDLACIAPVGLHALAGLLGRKRGAATWHSAKARDQAIAPVSGRPSLVAEAHAEDVPGLGLPEVGSSNCKAVRRAGSWYKVHLDADKGDDGAIHRSKYGELAAKCRKCLMKSCSQKGFAPPLYSILRPSSPMR